jgi:sortase A
MIRGFLKLLFGGTAMLYLGIFGYLIARRLSYQESESAAFDNEVKAPVSIRSKSPVIVGPVGRIFVPRLDLSAMVEEGTDDSTLSVAVGHLPGTALPGSFGNVAIAGHRDTFFRGLKDIQNGDEIRFTTKSGTFRYRVSSMMIVEPDNVGVLRSTAEPELTMITCYPFDFFGHAPKRFVVQARQVKW